MFNYTNVNPFQVTATAVTGTSPNADLLRFVLQIAITNYSSGSYSGPAPVAWVAAWFAQIESTNFPTGNSLGKKIAKLLSPYVLQEASR